MKTIMILGGGIMQLPAIRIAKEMGWRVIVADGNEDAPGRQEAHAFDHVDLRDREGMAAAASRHMKETGLDGVFTAGTDFSSTVAWTAEALGLPGIPYEAALNASRKGRMRRVFSEAGVPIPGFIEAGRDFSPLSILDKFDFPLVVKPVDNMGARGIRRVDDEDSLNSAFLSAVAYSGTGRVIIEEYIPGPEFSLDALVEDGEITVCGFADRHIFFPPYFIEMGHTMPTALSSGCQKDVIEVFKAGIRALGITRGAAKGDIKLSPRGPVVGEIAARLSGGFMSGWTFTYATGVEVTRGALRLAAGMSAGNLKPVRNWFSAERAFISIPGKVEEIKGFQEGKDVPGVKFSHMIAAPGSRTVFPRNNVEKCGNYISMAGNREDAVRAAEESCRNVEIRLVPGDSETLSFLTGDTCSWVPDAHELKSEKAIESIAGMPSVSHDFPGKGLVDDTLSEVLIAPVDESIFDAAPDWHGLSLMSALERCLEAGGRISDNGQWDLGSIFWKTLIKGGYQGGVWLLRTVRNLKTEDERKEFIGRWRN